jgi:aspartate aminotransferase
VFPEISGCIGKVTAGGRAIANDEDFAIALLEEAHVAVVQGSAFGMSPHVRISTATSETKLAAACARIAAFCGALRG